MMNNETRGKLGQEWWTMKQIFLLRNAKESGEQIINYSLRPQKLIPCLIGTGFKKDVIEVLFIDSGDWVPPLV